MLGGLLLIGLVFALWLLRRLIRRLVSRLYPDPKARHFWAGYVAAVLVWAGLAYAEDRAVAHWIDDRIIENGAPDRFLAILRDPETGLVELNGDYDCATVPLLYVYTYHLCLKVWTRASFFQQMDVYGPSRVLQPLTWTAFGYDLFAPGDQQFYFSADGRENYLDLGSIPVPPPAVRDPSLPDPHFKPPND